MDSRHNLVEELFPLSPRRYAPIPRRRRNCHGSNVEAYSATSVDSPGSPLNSMAVQRFSSPMELAKAAEELLEHFDQATTIRDDVQVATEETASSAYGKQNISGKESGRRLIDDGSGSSSGGEIEIKISGLMTPDDSSSSKNGLWEDGTSIVSVLDPCSTLGDWNAVPPPIMPTTEPSDSGRGYDCDHDGCYALTTRFIDDDRLSDDYAARGGGKKRKVPASAQQGPVQPGERDENVCLHSCGHICSEATTGAILNTMNNQTQSDERCGNSSTSDSDIQHGQLSCPHMRCCDHHSSIRIVPDPVIRVPKRRMTNARTAIGFEKRLFNARKAQVLGLYADAVTCLGHTKQKNAAIPSKEELEELIRALEYTGVTGWEGDKVGAGAGLWEGHVLKGRIKGETLIGTSETAGSLDLVTTSATTQAGAPNDQTTQDSVSQSLSKLNWRKRGRVAERYEWLNRKPVKRRGWIPEGTFEFEMPSTVASTLRSSNQKLNALRVKVTQLLTLTLSSPSMTSFLNGKPIPNPPSVTLPPPPSVTLPPPPSVTLPPPPLTAKIETENTNSSVGSSRANAKQKASANNVDIAETGGNTRNPLSSEKIQQVNGVPIKQKSTMPLSPKSSTSSVPPASIADAPKGDLAEQKQWPKHEANNSSPNVMVEPSADDPDYTPPQSAAKKGKKKKKKSAMANAANPHHVKNYVPSRRPVNAAPQTDMPNLVDILSMLFFPPPTRFLNSKPQRSDSKRSVQTLQQKSGQNRTTSDPADEEYVCSLCEYDLFFGSEQAMFRAIDRRKKVLERRQKAQEKAKGVMAGKGLRSKSKKNRDDGETEDDERCAGGEQCRCAELKAGNSRDKGNDADSRGLEDTSYSTEDDHDQAQGQFDDNATADALLIASDQQLESSSVAGLSSVSPSPTTLKSIPTRTASGDTAPPTEDEMPLLLPNVETFDLDESAAN